MVNANFKGENAHLLLTSDIITYSSILRQKYSTSLGTSQKHLLSQQSWYTVVGKSRFTVVRAEKDKQVMIKDMK